MVGETNLPSIHEAEGGGSPGNYRTKMTEGRGKLGEIVPIRESCKDLKWWLCLYNKP